MLFSLRVFIVISKLVAFTDHGCRIVQLPRGIGVRAATVNSAPHPKNRRSRRLQRFRLARSDPSQGQTNTACTFKIGLEAQKPTPSFCFDDPQYLKSVVGQRVGAGDGVDLELCHTLR